MVVGVLLNLQLCSEVINHANDLFEADLLALQRESDEVQNWAVLGRTGLHLLDESRSASLHCTGAHMTLRKTECTWRHILAKFNNILVV